MKTCTGSYLENPRSLSRDERGGTRFDAIPRGGAALTIRQPPARSVSPLAALREWAFAGSREEATWTLGLGRGVAHWAVAGLVLPLMDRMNPRVSSGRIEPFGPFGAGRGAMMIAGFLTSHLVFCAIVGWMYGVPVAPV